MLNKQVVNHRQIAWLVGSLLTTGIMVAFFRSIVQVAEMDAWFSQILPVCYAFVVAFVLMQVARKFPGKSLFEVIFILCGKWIGGAINLILIFYIWMIVTLDIKGVSHFLKESLLPRTPLGVILLVFVLLIMSYRKLDVMARVNEMYFPTYFLMCLSITLLMMNEYSLDWLEPILTSGLDDIFSANYMTAGLYGDVLLIGAFLPSLTNPRLLFVSMKHGIMLAGFMISVVLLVMLGVFGFKIGGSLNYPVWVLVQQIHITDFLDRTEIFLLSLWFPAFTIKVIAAYLALLVGIGSFTKNYSGVYNTGIGTFLVGSSLLSFYNAKQLQNFINYGYTAFVWAIQIPLLLLLLIGAASREARTDDVSRDIRKRRLMSGITYFSVFGCIASIVIGKIMYEMYASVGLAVSICYLFFLLTGVISSYSEMQIVNNTIHKTQQHTQHTKS